MGTYKQKRSRKPVPVKTLKLRLQDAFNSIEKVFHEDISEDDERLYNLRFKACHALSALAGRYAKITETEELEERIEQIEKKINHEKH
jgi:hypothetical protein